MVIVNAGKSKFFLCLSKYSLQKKTKITPKSYFSSFW